MVYRKPIYYTDTQKAEMWDRWQKGESLHAIARSFDRYHTSARGILVATGGIRPHERRRSRHVLTLAEREQISRGIVAGDSIRSIATSLGRAPSTISREINRNGGCRRYRACRADQAAWERAKRPKPCKLVINRALARNVAKQLRALWSPEQIAGWSKCAYPNDGGYQRHSRIKFVTPQQRHTSEDVQLLEKRHALYSRMIKLHPERWSTTTRNWQHEPVVELNPTHHKERKAA